jgi:hypothetical protein
MGWNDRDPGMYEAITGLHYETGLPLDHNGDPILPECKWCKGTGERNESDCAKCEGTGDEQ